MKLRGKHLFLECGHERDWPRKTTARGRIWCDVCNTWRKITAVR